MARWGPLALPTPHLIWHCHTSFAARKVATNPLERLARRVLNRQGLRKRERWAVAGPQEPPG